MTKKYERQCWYCKSRDLEDKGDYVQCRSCGATFNEVPSLGPAPLADHGYYLIDEDNVRVGRARRARRIQKSRRKLQA